ncbi:MAG: carbonic anhydrase family protein [Verrucomicrobiota bacterium]
MEKLSLPLLLTLAAFICPTSYAEAPPAAAVMTKERQQAMTPQDALLRLKEGNDRFVAGRLAHRDLLQEARLTAVGQHPFAAIVCCLDSRTAPEQVFDQGIGDIFCARVAGNVANNDIVGSLEYACKVVGARLIVVVGHESCGAVKGAVDRVKLGKLTGLLDKIEPAVIAAKRETGGSRSSSDHALVQRATVDNVALQMKNILHRSKILRGMFDKGEIALVGGIQDLKTGRVTFVNLNEGAAPGH